MDARQFRVRRVEQHHRAHIGVARHQITRRNLHLAPAANDDDATELRQQGQVFGEVHVGQHFENDVHPATARQRHCLREIIRRAVVERLRRALFEDQPAARFRARRADDGEAGGARDLRGRNAHAAARAVDEHRLTGQRAGPLVQGAIGRGVGNVDRRALRKAEVCGQAMNLVWRAEREFRVGPRQRVRSINPVAWPHVLHALADTLDDSGGVHTRRPGQRELGVRA